MVVSQAIYPTYRWFIIINIYKRLINLMFPRYPQHSPATKNPPWPVHGLVDGPEPGAFPTNHTQLMNGSATHSEILGNQSSNQGGLILVYKGWYKCLEISSQDSNHYHVEMNLPCFSDKTIHTPFNCCFEFAGDSRIGSEIYTLSNTTWSAAICWVTDLQLNFQPPSGRVQSSIWEGVFNWVIWEHWTNHHVPSCPMKIVKVHISRSPNHIALPPTFLSKNAADVHG